MAGKTPKSRAEIKAKSSHGGPRKNSGRKPAPVKKIRDEIVAAEADDRDVVAALDEALKGIAPQCVLNLVKLANGGFKQVKETLEPAGTVTVKVALTRPLFIKGEQQFDDAGRPLLVDEVDMNGNPVLVEKLAFPDLPADELVVTGRSVEVAAPDRAANQYILDRVMGKPRQAVEVTGKDGGPIPITFYIPDNGRDNHAQGHPAQLEAPGEVPQHPG
jgi:hypothetical protein